MASGIRCPHCSQKINLPPSADRQRIQCPMCKKPIERGPSSVFEPRQAFEPAEPVPSAKLTTKSTNQASDSNRQPPREESINPNLNESDQRSWLGALGCGCLLIVLLGLTVLIVILSRQWLQH